MARGFHTCEKENTRRLEPTSFIPLRDSVATRSDFAGHVPSRNSRLFSSSGQHNYAYYFALLGQPHAYVLFPVRCSKQL